MNTNYFIHKSAFVSPDAIIGKGTRIWNNAQVREGVRIGDNVIVSKNVYVDAGVVIGNNVKIQNNASIYHGVTIEDGVFVGPHVCLTNDRYPRAVNKNGSLKGTDDWEVSPTTVKTGASLGASSVLLPGVVIGCYAMIGAGSVVTHSILDHELVVGNPARRIGYVCFCGRTLEARNCTYYCGHCNKIINIQEHDQHA